MEQEILGADAASTYGGGAEGSCHAVRLRSRLSVKWTCLFIDYLIPERQGQLLRKNAACYTRRVS
jgi:hypothetical protein